MLRNVAWASVESCKGVLFGFSFPVSPSFFLTKCRGIRKSKSLLHIEAQIQKGKISTKDAAGT